MVELALDRQIQHHQDSEDAAATQWRQPTWTEMAFVGIINNQNTNNSINPHLPSGSIRTMTE